MIPNNDPRWESIVGGYRTPYDPRPALARLKVNGRDAAAWDELWTKLHHQGDLGDASYVALVELARIRDTTALSSDDLFSLVSTIEVERHRRTNPPVPSWLVAEYRDAWNALLRFALAELNESADPLTIKLALTTVTLAKGLCPLGAFIWHHDEDTLAEYLEQHLGWAELYARKAD